MSSNHISIEQLPDSRVFCSAHGRVVCDFCSVDFSFAHQILYDNSGEDDYSSDRADSEPASDYNTAIFTQPDRSNRLISVLAPMPTTFVRPPGCDTNPQQMFPDGRTSTGVVRFLDRRDPTQSLIYTDGACLDNGRPNARAGCAFVYRSADPGAKGRVSFRLENKGPDSKPHPQTSNRAELRAVLAALEFHHWKRDGINSLVIATDSEYVAKGATDWVHRWQRNYWTTARGTPVLNRDLWMELWYQFECWAEAGLRILFWKIPRELNTEADRWARAAAAEEEQEEFRDIYEALV